MADDRFGGTADDQDDRDPGTGTGQAGDSATAGTGGSQPTFFDPANVPPELQDTWRRMQGSFTKKMQGFAGKEEQAELVERFNTDPDFAMQVMQQRAAQLGITLGQASPGTATPASNVPREIVEAVEAQLTPELRWMAPSQAAAMWTVLQKMMGPKLQADEAEAKRRNTEEYETLSDQLTETAPGWVEHEQEMTDLLEFIQSDRMRHRKWGSKLEVLHRIVTGNAAAIAEAARRQGEAVRARTVTGGTGRATVPNVEDKVMKAGTSRDAFAEAAKAAQQEMEREGRRID